MRQILRRLAVTALIAPVAAIGASTIFASPAAAAAKPVPSQPGMWMSGPSMDGSWLIDSSQPGSWIPSGGSWKSNPWKSQPGSRKPSPWTPAQPAPSTSAPTTPAPTGSTPAAGSKEQTLQNEVNKLINVQRANNGCAALTVNDQLTKAARDHSVWMAQTGNFSHTGSGGSSFVTRAKAAGYHNPSAENIAMGYRSASEVVNGWMNSPGHRANIVNCQSKTVGVGVAFAADGSPYYTQDFGY